MTKTNGFSIFEICLVIVVLAVVGGVGYLAYTNFGASSSDSSAKVSPSPSSSPATITNVQDLELVDSQLDAISVDDADSAQLDSSTANF